MQRGGDAIQRSDCIVNTTAVILTVEIARPVKRKNSSRTHREVFHGAAIVNCDMLK